VTDDSPAVALAPVSGVCGLAPPTPIHEVLNVATPTIRSPNFEDRRTKRQGNKPPNDSRATSSAHAPDRRFEDR